jgi:hypothetical protein
LSSVEIQEMDKILDKRSLVSISIPAVAVKSLTIGKKNKSLIMAPHQLRCKQSLIFCVILYFYNRILQEQDVKCVLNKAKQIYENQTEVKCGL